MISIIILIVLVSALLIVSTILLIFSLKKKQVCECVECVECASCKPDPVVAPKQKLFNEIPFKDRQEIGLVFSSRLIIPTYEGPLVTITHPDTDITGDFYEAPNKTDSGFSLYSPELDIYLKDWFADEKVGKVNAIYDQLNGAANQERGGKFLTIKNNGVLINKGFRMIGPVKNNVNTKQVAFTVAGNFIKNTSGIYSEEDIISIRDSLTTVVCGSCFTLTKDNTATYFYNDNSGASNSWSSSNLFQNLILKVPYSYLLSFGNDKKLNASLSDGQKVVDRTLTTGPFCKAKDKETSMIGNNTCDFEFKDIIWFNIDITDPDTLKTINKIIAW